MDQKRFELLKKRADNCIEKLTAVVNNQTDNAQIHDTNWMIGTLKNSIAWIEKYNGEYIGKFTQIHYDLNYLESNINKSENYLLEKAKRIKCLTKNLF